MPEFLLPFLSLFGLSVLEAAAPRRWLLDYIPRSVLGPSIGLNSKRLGSLTDLTNDLRLIKLFSCVCSRLSRLLVTSLERLRCPRPCRPCRLRPAKACRPESRESTVATAQAVSGPDLHLPMSAKELKAAGAQKPRYASWKKNTTVQSCWTEMNWSSNNSPRTFRRKRFCTWEQKHSKVHAFRWEFPPEVHSRRHGNTSLLSI